MKNSIVLSALLILFQSCYSYKTIEPPTSEFVVGQKYEIRIADREKRKVLVNQVTDSTIIVEQNKSEITIKKSLITERRLIEFSTGKTIVAVTLGVLGTLFTFGIISLTSGDGLGGGFECC